MIKAFQFILYVKDQQSSAIFYEQLFQIQPSLNVPGMTEFMLFDNVKLGLMPENGIANLLVPHMPHPSDGNGIPRCEMYLKVENAAVYMQRGIDLGGKLINPLQNRDWGDTVGYIADMDGHIIAFAQE